jgi:hypothetical protein
MVIRHSHGRNSGPCYFGENYYLQTIDALTFESPVKFT